MIIHTINYLEEDIPFWAEPAVVVIRLFPGVPIFFVVSGFLVSFSFEKSDTIKTYFKSRFLRIYPALWFCLGITLLIVVLNGYWDRREFKVPYFSIWFSSEIIFGHLYSSEIFSEWGTGKLNGSLWTVPVEIQFYLFLPVLYLVINHLKKIWVVFFLSGLLFLSIGTSYVVLKNHFIEHYYLWKVAEKILPTYLYLFLAGMLLKTSYIKWPWVFKGTVMYWLAGYLLVSFAAVKWFGIRIGSHPPEYFLSMILACLTISFAFSFCSLADSIIGRTDISYGIYLYHMVVMNLMIEMGALKWPKAFGMTATMIITILLAIISWFLIEKKCLKLKN
jgi:peptidoglycan/LPS O-acetylase OafA/YrhL